MGCPRLACNFAKVAMLFFVFVSALSCGVPELPGRRHC